MENNFIQMAASVGHAVAYMIGPIFKHIIDCRRNIYLLSFSKKNGPIMSLYQNPHQTELFQKQS